MKIVILGGGTVGWLAAYYFRKRHPLDEVTVIESSKIGVIGAGESTTTNFLPFLNYLQIEPIELTKKTGGTFKTGTRFKNWNGDNNEYYNVITPWVPELSPSGYAEYNNVSDVDAKVYCQLVEDHFPMHLFGANNLLTKNFTPFYATENRTIAELSKYTVNIDGTKFSQYLRNFRKARNVKLIDGIISSFERDGSNNISEVILEDGTKISADIIIDCSGFSRLTAKEYSTPWISYKKYLPIDSTIPFFLKPGRDIPAFVDIIALKYGWSFKIPMQNRFGSGYNFSSQYTDWDSARKEIEQYLGHDVDVIKKISYESGHYEKCWYNNCISLGMASGFLEPMAASNISTAIEVLKKINLRKFMSGDTSQRDMVNKEYLLLNEIFLNNVYFRYITKRKDTDFWKSFSIDNAPESLKTIVNKFIDTKDFIGFCNDMHQSPIIWLAALDGLKIPEYDKALSKFRSEARDVNTIRLVNRIQAEAQKFANKMIPQRDFFDLDIMYISPDFNTPIDSSYVN